MNSFIQVSFYHWTWWLGKIKDLHAESELKTIMIRYVIRITILPFHKHYKGGNGLGKSIISYRKTFCHTRKTLTDQLQWCNLILAWWFWATKVCLRASKISQICLFGHPTGQATFWKIFKIFFRPRNTNTFFRNILEI